MSPNRTIRLTPRQAVWALISLTVVITVSLVVVSVLVAATKTTEIRQDQTELGPIIRNTSKSLDNTEKTLDVLIDCTQPEGQCYKRGQETTQGAVENITKYAVYAAVCVDEPGRQTVEETTACIVKLVKAEELAKKDN